MALLNSFQERWCADHAAETADLLRTLGKIPAPSHHEEKRAEFVRDWLTAQGAEGVYIDEALNVIYPVGVTEDNPVVAIMAHTDIVFPDTEELLMREEDGKLYAPGIGDDTGNVVVLMMAAKYIAEQRPDPSVGVLIVANSCEEGLGNLKGSKQIMSDFAGRIQELISLDGGPEDIINDAVGSCRMKVTIRAQGGHSFSDFGNTNAIVQMAELIQALYQKKVPEKARTTYNAGVIEGGTTVNSICGECSLLYEYRSENRECLAEMEDFFQATIADFRARGYDISVEVLGLRPCTGDVDPAKLADLSDRLENILREFTGSENIGQYAASTDANSALAIGIPAATTGAIVSSGAHTRGEWLDLSSLPTGQKIALATVLQYFK